MCGLVGIFGDVNEKAKKCFNILHHLDVLRGRDGAGVFVHRTDGTSDLMKVPSVPDDLHWSYHKEFDENGLLVDKNLNLVLGHNRWKTVGDVNEENTHPFLFDRIAGAHNGTVSKYSIKHFPEYSDDTVDSKVLYAGINAMTKGKFDHRNTFKHIVDDCTGPMALTWFDLETKELNIFRNPQRSLYGTLSTDGTLLIWASEDWMIYVAANKAGIKVDKVIEFKQNLHVKYKLKDKNNKVAVRICHKELINKTFTNTGFGSGYGGYGGFFDNDLLDDIKDQGDTNSKVTVLRKNVNGHGGRYFVFNQYLTEEEFEHRVRHGCCLCGSNVSFADRIDIKWFDKVTVLCKDCQGGSALEYMDPASVGRLEGGKDVH